MLIVVGYVRQFRATLEMLLAISSISSARPAASNVTGDGLSGEHRRAQEVDIGLGAGPFGAVDGLQG